MNFNYLNAVARRQICLKLISLSFIVLLLPLQSKSQSIPNANSIQIDPPSVTVPLVIKFAGVTKHGNGVPKIAGITFGMFEHSEGGSPLWIETQNVLPDQNGRYTVVLGSTQVEGIPLSLFVNGTARWIGLLSDQDSPSPRTLLASVPYALKALDAESLGGTPSSDFVRTTQLAQILGNAFSQTSVPTLSPTAKMQVDFTSLIHPLLPGVNIPEVSTPKPSIQSFIGGLRLPPRTPAPPNSAVGASSAGLDLEASAFNVQSNSAEKELFRWQAEPVGSDTANPSGRLSLLFGSKGAVPQHTGFFINADGTLGLGSGQQIPLPAIQSALVEAGLTTSSTNASGGGPSLPPIVNTAQYTWQQNEKTAIKAGQNTIALVPCPRGLNGTDLWHYLYISSTGTPEAVLITGGSCTSGAASGNVQFVAAFSHPAGYTLGSATQGVQEAVNDAVFKGSSGQTARSVLIDPKEYLFQARLSIRASSVTISASGATITCAMSDTCIMLGDPSNSNLFNAITIQGLRFRAGVNKGTWPALEDNAMGSAIRNLATVNALNAGDSFGYLIQVDNDQAAVIDQLNAGLGAWSRCDATFCSTAVFGPGPFSVSAGVIWVQNSNLSFQCEANGIDNQNGNTLHVSNSVVQGYTQFGVRSYQLYSTSFVQLDNVYEEVGDCTNPLGTGIAGLIVENGSAQVSGGVGPAGLLPQYANTGQTQYNYYIVVQSSTMGTSPAYLAGYANTNGSGTIPVVWNQVGTAGVITYDVLRISGAPSATTAAPYGTGVFAIATGVTTANCSNKVCSLLDNAASTPVSYSIPPTTVYDPALLNWPGSVILTGNKDSQNTGGLEPTRYVSQTVGQGGFVNSDGANQPSVIAQECDPMVQQSAIWMDCQNGSAVSNDFNPIVGTLIQNSANGGQPGGLKGRFIFEEPALSSVPATHIITLADSNPAKTLASPMHRPSWDAADTYIGYDQPNNVAVQSTQLSFGSPVSISNYIANPGDGTNWLERLTSSLKSFKVTVNAPAFQTATNCASSTGACQSAAAGAVAISHGTTSVTVSTTAINQGSEVHVDENFSYDPLLNVTCDQTLGRHYAITNQLPGESFDIITDAAPTNSACLSYSITN